MSGLYWYRFVSCKTNSITRYLPVLLTFNERCSYFALAFMFQCPFCEVLYIAIDYCESISNILFVFPEWVSATVKTSLILPLVLPAQMTLILHPPLKILTLVVPGRSWLCCLAQLQIFWSAYTFLEPEQPRNLLQCHYTDISPNSLLLLHCPKFW